ncbi:MAG: 5-bromo-4-chloroindolyl phosphate hydrolysis family protein [Lawsonibacter sp.]|jgi:hypothetical protein
MADNSRKSSGNTLSSWILPIIFLVLFPPVGILLVVLKLFSGSRPRGRHPYYTQRESQGPIGARTTASQPASPPTRKKQKIQKVGAADLVADLSRKGKRLTTIGAVVAAIFTFAILASLSNSAYYLLEGETRWFLSNLFDLLPNFCFVAGGLGCLWAGIRRRKQASRYRNYLAMIGRRQSISVSTLSSATRLSPERVREDLEDMLEFGIFPTGFLDYGGDTLVLTGEGLSDSPSPTSQPNPQPKTDTNPENSILAEIRAVNDAVENEKLSAQIDRIGIITAKILEYQHSRPEKAPQLHSFLSYYLPTTLKILRAYGQLESQQVAGENITAAMQRIEGMMDKVVEGFEKQLDQLFQGEAMDITADVAVLERMLAKDGLSTDQSITLGL